MKITWIDVTQGIELFAGDVTQSIESFAGDETGKVVGGFTQGSNNLFTVYVGDRDKYIGRYTTKEFAKLAVENYWNYPRLGFWETIARFFGR